MQEQTLVSGARSEDPSSLANKFLARAGTFWFQVAALGQGAFVIYIVAFYYTSTLQGNFEKWNEVLPKGYIADDWLGNLFLLVHLILAAVITFGGFIQLIPQIRKRAIKVHRWNGRIYMLTALIMSLTGIGLAFFRGVIGGAPAAIGIGLDGVLIIVFAIVAWRYAMKKNIAQHQKWALRLFMVVSGVWFFRVGLMLWLMIHRAPVGFDPQSFTGPFLTFLNFACYMLPLLFLELYFQAKEKGSVTAKWAMAGVVMCAALLMGGGIFSAVMGMWLPRI